MRLTLNLPRARSTFFCRIHAYSLSLVKFASFINRAVSPFSLFVSFESHLFFIIIQYKYTVGQ